jgi:poly(A) polymerase
MLELLEQPGFALAAATLLHTLPAETVRGICRRLRLSTSETDHVVWLLAHRHDLVDAPHSRPARLKRLLAHVWSGDLISLARVEALAAGEDLSNVSFTEDFLRDTPPAELDPPPLVTGDDLIAAGLKPSPRFKSLLDTIRDAQLDGEICTRAGALELLDRLRQDGEEGSLRG